MRICLIASSRHPVRQPFAGGLEAFTHGLAAGLAARGHQVSLFAAVDTDPDLDVEILRPDSFEPSAVSLHDTHAPSATWVAEHHAYLGVMMRLMRGGDLAAAFDVVHNVSLHHLPVAMSDALQTPLLTTLHTPPLPWLESAVRLARNPARATFVAVSAHTARSWAHVLNASVILNGVDVEQWRPGAGGGPAVWSGRLVREKAPHEAIEACRLAGIPLVLAGPAHDDHYFATEIRPRLGHDVSYAGHLDVSDLTRLLQRASVSVVTPNWDEPYGLVAAEAMACGTPVAAYARGGLPEVIGDAGRLARPGDIGSLAAAIKAAIGLDRHDVRRRAEQSCSLARMLGQYESHYLELAARPITVAS